MSIASRQLRLITFIILVIGSSLYGVVLLDISAFIITLTAGLVFIFIPLHNWLTARNMNAKLLKEVTVYQLVLSLGAVIVQTSERLINAFISHGCSGGGMSEMGNPGCVPVEASADINPVFVNFGWLGTWAFWILAASFFATVLITPVVIGRYFAMRSHVKN